MNDRWLSGAMRMDVFTYGEHVVRRGSGQPLRGSNKRRALKEVGKKQPTR